MTASAVTSPELNAAVDPRRWKVLGLLGLIQFMFLLDSTVVNPALPTIQRELHFSTSSLVWVVNGYTLMAGGFLIVGGRVADLLGRRRMFVAGAVLFTAASAISGLSQTSTMLVVARFAQGLGEAVASPAALSLVVLAFTDPVERVKAVSAWGGIAGLGATLGVVISGVIVDELSWRWIFLVNVPVAAFVLATAPRMVKESRPSGSPRIDYLGAVLVTSGLTLIVDGLLQKSSHAWGSGTVVIPLIVGGALLVALVGSQIAQRDPLIPRRFFANRTRVSANAATMFATAGFFSLFFSMTLYLQGVLHYSALKTGLAWGPFGLMLFVGLGVGQKLLPRIGVKNGLTVSYLVSAGGLFWLGHIGSHSHYASEILPGMLMMAFGQSISFIGLLNSALHRLGPADAGLGSAVQSTSQQLGGSLGLAIVISIALNHTATKIAHGVAPVVASIDGYSLAINLGAAVMVAGAVVVALAFEKVDFTAPDKLAMEAAEAEASDLRVATPGDRPRRRRPELSRELRVERQGRARYRFQRLHRRRDRTAACRRGHSDDRFAPAAGSLLTRQGPLAGRYPAVAAMVILALVPYLALSAALQPLAPIIARQLHMSLQAMSLTEGLANAGYAMGTVFAVQFALRLPQRRMLLIYGVLLVVGSVLAASATAPGVFVAGHVLQGVCTSLLLIAAFPPLIVGYPASKLRWTAMVVNVCVFGAVALGPVVGGIQASAHAWRPLFWIIAGIALGALLLSVLTFQDAPPVDPRRRWDPLALGLAASGCVAAFFGASELLTHPFFDAITFVPLIGGLALIVTLLIAEYRGRCALLNVRPLVSTLPVAGILAAICAAAASVSAIALSGVLLAHRYAPLHAGLLYLPEFFGAAVSAVVFGFVFRTRGLHYQVLAGVIFLGAGIVVIGRVLPPSDALALTGLGLIGLGVGSTVVPALFIAGFSVPNSNLQRVFAIIELLRAVAAFMIAPVMLHFAFTVGHSLDSGTTVALWICFGISTGGALVGVCLYALGRVTPPAPSLERWFGGREPGWYSPPLLAGIRRQMNATRQAAPAVATSANDDGDDERHGQPRDKRK